MLTPFVFCNLYAHLNTQGITHPQLAQAVRVPERDGASLSSKLVDVDGDGYLEQTQWVQSNQAILAVDLNGDRQISVGERVNLQDGQARTSMQWLDVNGDHRLDASDSAFAAANDELFRSAA